MKIDSFSQRPDFSICSDCKKRRKTLKNTDENRKSQYFQLSQKSLFLASISFLFCLFFTSNAPLSGQSYTSKAVFKSQQNSADYLMSIKSSKKTKKHGKLEFLGGKSSLQDRTPWDTLIRELKEEDLSHVLSQIALETPYTQHTLHYKNKKLHIFTFSIPHEFLQSNLLSALNHNTLESQGFSWFSSESEKDADKKLTKQSFVILKNDLRED